MKRIRIFDSTLRDGQHAVKQQLLPDQIQHYCECIDGVGMHTVIVGHGNGIGASSILMTRTAMDEIEMLKLARKSLRETNLGTFFTVGFGTIDGQIKPALEAGVDTFCIASHCTEVDTMRKHIGYLADCGHEVYGVMMNTHLVSKEALCDSAKKIQDYGADGVILMDSAGAFTPERTDAVISFLFGRLNIDIGFHAHNNLSLAVANAYTAIKCGATIIDGTVHGFGAGAGNCQLEALIALLQKEGIETNVNLFRVLDAGKAVIEDEIGYKSGIDGTSIVSGYAGVVSTFKQQVIRVAEMYRVDPRDIFVELGKRKAISGQDDLILEVGRQLSVKRRDSCEAKNG